MAGRAVSVVVASLATVVTAGLVVAPGADAKPPAKVSKVKVTSVSSTSAVVSWKVPKSSRGTVVRVAKGKKAPKSPTAGRAVGTVGKKKHTVKATRLKAGTVYTVSLFSKSAGHYAKAAVVRLQTAPAAISGLYAQTSTTAIALRWQAPSRTATTTIVRYSTGAAPTKPSAGKAVAVRGRAHAAVVKGLRPGTSYRFSLWAVDKAHRLSPRATATFATARPTTGVVTGAVTEAATKKALRGARVYLIGNEDGETAGTAANGSFSFSGVEPGHYAVRVFGDGATGGTSRAGWLPELKNIVVTAGVSRRVDVALDKAAGVRGKAVDADDDKPVAEAWVSAPNADMSEWFGESETEDDGTFELTELEPQRSKSVCVDDSYADVSDDAATGHQLECQQVTLVAGEIIDLATFRLARGAAIAGTIDLNGSYDAEITVYDAAGKFAGYGYAEEDEDHPTTPVAYKVGGLPAGKVTVCVSVEAFDEDDAPVDEYASQCYDGTAGGAAWEPDTDKPASGALPVDVTVGQTTKPIDFTLKQK